MSTTVDQIKEKLSIVDVVGSYIELQKAGSNFKAKCPFHNEKSPSFFISPVRNSFYCFGCGVKGDIFSFVEQFENQDFLGSLKILADRAGVEIKRENPKVKDARERLFMVLETATIFFQRNLIDNKEALSYLWGRGLSKETMSTWRLGFALNDWRTLHDHLLTKGFSVNEMEQAGLIKKTEKGFYDRFRSRIMFPLFDSSGRVVGFSGRIFGEESEAKYLNSPETPLFNKSELLYGFDKAKLEIRRRSAVVLVEGQMDLLMAHQAGTANAVATSGTALTIKHLEMLKKLTQNIILAFDTDSAGFSATERSTREALTLGFEVKVASITSGKDPADLIKTNPDEWLKTLENSKHIIDYQFERLKATVADKTEFSKALRKNILPYIGLLEGNMDKARFVKNIAFESGIKEDAVWDDLKKVQTGVQSADVKPVDPRATFTRLDYIERRLLGQMYWLETNNKKDKAETLAARFKKIIGENEYKEKTHDLLDYRNEMILEAELHFEKHADLDKEIDALFQELERDHVKKEFAKTLAELSVAESKRDNEKTLHLMKRLQELSAKMGNKEM